MGKRAVEECNAHFQGQFNLYKLNNSYTVLLVYILDEKERAVLFGEKDVIEEYQGLDQVEL